MPDFPPPNVGHWPAPSRPGGLPKLVLARRRPSVSIGHSGTAVEECQEPEPALAEPRFAPAHGATAPNGVVGMFHAGAPMPQSSQPSFSGLAVMPQAATAVPHPAPLVYVAAAQATPIPYVAAAHVAPVHAAPVSYVATAVSPGELEKSVRALETRLTERERAVDELAARLAEREREIAETQALLTAREKVLEAALQQEPKRGTMSEQEQAALTALKAELQRQEAAVKEAKADLKQREAFLEESENRLFEKVQAQQEKESELEQREEDVRARERRLREREAEHDPAVAAALAEEKARAAAYDEFSE